MPVLSGNTFAAGLDARFRDTYRRSYEGQLENVGVFMDMTITTDLLTVPYAFRESMPIPKRWERGKDRKSEGTGSVTWNTTNKDWSLSIDWHENDRIYDQLKSFEADVMHGATRWAQLPWRVSNQIQTGGTDLDLLDYLPLAPDGVGMYSATDGDGNDRYGVSGGNIYSVAAAGTGTSKALRSAYHACRTRWVQMQDTKGEPLIDPGVFEMGFLIQHAPEYEEVFAEAFLQTRTLDGSAAVTSVPQERGDKVRCWSDARLTGTTWYIHLVGAHVKPLYRQMVNTPERPALRFIPQTMEGGSDESRKTKKESANWDSMEGYGLANCDSTMKVTAP